MKRVLILSAALATGCMPAANPAERAATLTVAKAFTPTSLDPAVAAGANEAPVLDQVYEQLTRLDPASPTAEAVGELAQDWTVAPDGLSIAVRLQSGHRFDDGSPVDAGAVKASLDRLVRIGRAPAGSVEFLGGVTVTGPLSLTLHLKRRYAPAMQQLSLVAASIINPRAFAGNDDGKSWLADHSAGSGPYRIAANRPGEAIELVANPKAFRPPRQFQRVVIRALPDEGVRRLLLERGDVDLTDIVPSVLVDRYRALPGVAVTTVPGGSSLSYLQLNAAKGPLTDQRLREAVALAVDYDGLRRQILKGNAIQIGGYLPPGAPGYRIGETPSRDLPRARALVQAAGYKGEPIVLLVALLGPVAEFLQANLADAGLTVRIERRSPGAMQALQASGDFGLIYTGWSNDTPDPGAMLDALYSARGLAAGTNGSGIADPAIDGLIDTALASRDLATRAAAYAEIDARLRKARPLVMIFAANPVIAHRADLIGVTIDRWRPSLIDFSGLSRRRPKP
ncbi:ABC transporter substrate-binding protein [Novosphingobium sp.]|uniref:ABC transporter substrate-binding protein n=1 Tax=Novosphingobium sp. TaxID=1874826 RepID=UPI003BABFC5B